MEPIGACFDEEWESSLSRIFSSLEADHFKAHLYRANNEYGNTFTNNGITSSIFFPIDDTIVSVNEIESTNFYDFANSFYTNTNFNHLSEESGNTSSSNSPFFPAQSYENSHFFSGFNKMQVMDNNIHESTIISSDEFLVPNFPHHVIEEFLFMKTEMVKEKSENDDNQASCFADLGEELKLKLKRKINMKEHEESGDEKKNNLIGSPKKKPRLPRNAQKGKSNALSKKNKNISLNGTDENNVTRDIQNHSSSCSSEDDNSSQDSKGEINAALNSSRKTRARRGVATDPQSLYARRRRERINERLRILQNLVPNGTKVDISTMLEEAVHYVKFLQLQIKFLSSDEMWMFAPIAYNGMDMDIFRKISI